jgi:hypothetical protein
MLKKKLDKNFKKLYNYNNSKIKALVMKLVDMLVLGTSAEKHAGSNPAEGIKIKKAKKN